MGIPYSKQINAAFDQVTPLVAAGFEVLQTTKNISILLAAIQVLTAILLILILITLIALLVIVNPDMDHERRHIVTPIMKWFFEKSLTTLMWVVLFAAVFTGAGYWYAYSTDIKQLEDGEEGGDEGQGGEAGKGAADKEKADADKKAKEDADNKGKEKK